jgi:hypothetical protein
MQPLATSVSISKIMKLLLLFAFLVGLFSSASAQWVKQGVNTSANFRGLSFALPKNYLSFFSHQGYMASWFELPKLSDDPPCWFYHEGMGLKEPIIDGTFTEVLIKDMRGLAE